MFKVTAGSEARTRVWESDAKADGREVLNLEMRAVKKFRE